MTSLHKVTRVTGPQEEGRAGRLSPLAHSLSPLFPFPLGNRALTETWLRCPPERPPSFKDTVPIPVEIFNEWNAALSHKESVPGFISKFKADFFFFLGFLCQKVARDVRISQIQSQGLTPAALLATAKHQVDKTNSFNPSPSLEALLL